MIENKPTTTTIQGESNMSKVAQWYRKVVQLSNTDQSEIFALTGDVTSYPVLPNEGIADYIYRMDVGYKTAREGVAFSTRTSEERTAVANTHVFATLSPALGLQFRDGETMQVFNQSAPPAEDNPFAAQTSGGILEDLARVEQYMGNGNATPITLVIHDADLIFDADQPLVEPERTVISYLRAWAGRPLVNAAGDPHRIYLISSAPQLRPQLMVGRITPVEVQLPDVDERRAFIVKVLDALGEDGSTQEFEDGLDIEQMARQTGALNLLQIEDVLYQAANDGGMIRREQVRDRKDELVSQTYGGVLQIQYPDDGFESIVGYDDLKKYFTGWVAKKLAVGAPDSPKGCLLSGPPGTGKTKFAQALAASLNLPLVVVEMDKIKSKYVGESNKAMAKLIEGIKALSPAVVLFDEVDKVLGSVDDSSGVSQELQGQLQTWMSDAPRGEVFFVATTNYPKAVGGALVRPGRLEQIVPLLPAHLDGIRTEVFKLVASKLSIQTTLDSEMSAEHVERLEAAMADYTGADMEKLAMEASYEATLDDCEIVDYDHIITASQCVKATIHQSQQNQDMVDDAVETTSNLRFLPKVTREEEASATPSPRRRIRQAG